MKDLAGGRWFPRTHVYVTRLSQIGAGFRIGMVHDVLDPHEYPKWPLSRTMETYFGGPTRSHRLRPSHVEIDQAIRQCLVINPGSPTFPHNYSAQPGTVAVLTLEENRGGAVTVYDLKTSQRCQG